MATGDRVTEAPPPPEFTYVGSLTPEQRARSEALQDARAALRGWGFASSAPDAMDLYSIADYIITGRDPWESTAVADAS